MITAPLARSSRCLLLLLSLLAFQSLRAQTSEPSTRKVTAALAAGQSESALSMLTKLLEKSPTDVSLLRVRMNILLGMRRNWEAMGCALELLEVLPEGLEKESLRAFADLSRKTRGELQELIERAVMYREARKPKDLLKIWLKLKKLRPGDPVVHFGMGAVYGSAGAHYDAKKARAEFKKFLDLTTDERFRVGGIYSPIELATSLRRFSSLDPNGSLQDLRLVVHDYMDRLKDKQHLYLVTPLRTIAKMKAKVEEELEDRNRTIRKAESDIERCREYIRTPSRRGHNLHNVKWQKIRQLEKQIAREKPKVKVLKVKLERLRAAY